MQTTHRRSYTSEEVSLAQAQQAAQQRLYGKAQSLAAILRAATPRPGEAGKPVSSRPTELTARQLRRRDGYGQLALQADQLALVETVPERRFNARQASSLLKGLSSAQQLEFDFFGGTMITSLDYMRAVRERLKETGATLARRGLTTMILQYVIEHLAWQTYTSTATAAEIADALGADEREVSICLNLLEQIGAIHRVKKGRIKIITVTPEAAYRGDVNKHAEVMARYKAEVVPLRRNIRPKNSEPPGAA